MKVKFSGVGGARGIDLIAERPCCPRVDETVEIPVIDAEEKEDTATWYVRHVQHVLDKDADHDVYVVIGSALRSC